MVKKSVGLADSPSQSRQGYATDTWFSTACVAYRWRVTEPNPGYSGMTVNERLAVAGFIGDFDAAIRAGDRQAAIDILCSVEFTPESSAGTVDALYANPVFYGYPSRIKK